MGNPLVNLTTKIISLTKRQLGIIQDFETRLKSFQRHNKFAKSFIEAGEELIRNPNTENYNSFFGLKKILEKEVTFSLHFLSQEEIEEGEEAEILSEEREADRTALQMLETEHAELWRNIKLLREGEVKIALQGFLCELEKEKDDLEKEKKINAFLEKLLKELAAVIEDEQRELELELNILQQKCSFAYSNFDEFKKAELSSALETLEVNLNNLENILKKEQGRLINPYKVFTNQKSIVTKKILDLAKRKVITSAMVKRDIRSLNPTQAQEYLEQLAKYYPLTQVANRRLADQVLAERIWLTLKQSGTISVFLIDVDFFKKINDEYGHRAGDVILIQIASILSSFFAPPHDIVCRWGGEEFLVIFAPMTHIEEAEQTAEKIRGMMEKEIKKNISKYPAGEDLGIAKLKKDIESGEKIVTISGGLASIELKQKRFPEKEDTNRIIELLITTADGKLYEAKQSGRNAVLFVRLQA